MDGLQDIEEDDPKDVYQREQASMWERWKWEFNTQSQIYFARNCTKRLKVIYILQQPLPFHHSQNPLSPATQLVNSKK